MSYTLGGITLPRPKGYKQTFIETSTENLTLNGETKKSYISRRKQHVLHFTMLTQAQVNNILSVYQNNEVASYQVDETNLSVGPVDVLIDISDRLYLEQTVNYREAFDLILTEVGNS